MFKRMTHVPGQCARGIATSKPLNFKVTVVGAAGGIGQPLSLLLKLNKLVTDLRLYDVAKVTPGIAVDLSHVETKSKVQGFVGPDKLQEALCGADIVVCPAGVPRKPGMTRDDLFKTNAGIVRDLACAVGTACPKALLAIITNPVNSVVPIAAEVLKAKGVYDDKRLFGVSTLDIVRSCTFIGQAQCEDPKKVSCPVIGGHAGITIIPVLSQSKPKFEGPQKEIEELTKRIQEAGTEVVKAKAGGGSATLSMAYAGHRFVNSLMRGLKGDKKVIECSYVNSKVTEVAFFANPVRLGKCGIVENLGLPCLNDYEEKLLKAALPVLKKNIQTGVDFVKKG